MAEAQYFLKRGDAVKGPFSSPKLQSLLAAKKLKANDLVGASNDGPWERMAAVHKSIRAGQPLELGTETAAKTERTASPAQEPQNPNLIECADCGTQVSKRATTCPNCGAPIGDAGVSKEGDGDDDYSDDDYSDDDYSDDDYSDDDYSDDGDIFSGPIGSWGEAIEEEDYDLYDIPPKRKAKRKAKRKDREADFNPRTGEGKYRILVENNESPNKFVTVLYFCWDAVPTFVKLITLVAVLAYIIVVMPLLHFQEDSYWYEGGPYGHNTTDTLYMAKARGGGHNELADFHLARRELRKAIVRVHRAVDMLVNNEVFSEQEAKNYQSNKLQSMAKEYLLTKNVWGKDFIGIGEQTDDMNFAATMFNTIADQLGNPDFVDQNRETLKEALRSQ